MSISFMETNQQFHLKTYNTSYLMELRTGGQLVHGYWGKRIHTPHLDHLVDLFEVCSFSPNPVEDHNEISFDTMPREYPDYGRSDYQSPAFEVTLEDGSHIVDLKYVSHRIYNGKKKLPGLPAIYCDLEETVMTLEISLRDDISSLEVMLSYTVFELYDTITRHVTFINGGTQGITLNKALSASVDFYQDANFELINLHGSWARERHISRIPLGHSNHYVDSKRGASSHEQNPLIALVRPDTTEDQGHVYGMNFVYSGSFIGDISVNSYGGTRMQMGLNPIDFSWELEPEGTFTTPEVVMVYSDQGLNGMSQIYHKLYRECLCRGEWQYKERPVLINNWEATYFDFTQAKIEAIIDASWDLGIELMVLDDGWFGKRNSDQSSLGDWVVNKEKLPGGLAHLANYALQKGMRFGLWFEPEMVSPESDLYKAHPDWCLHVDHRYRSQARNQLVLDYSREDVRVYIVNQLEEILNSAPITYVKWDMNRNMTEVGSALLKGKKHKETSHRYILGLYEVLETITSRFPQILFESCSGGGGRFDPGMLYYMPQTWTSDDTDSYERLKIQWGTSLVYPPITMGSHVSVVPNHQVHRLTPLETRGHVAMSGNMGYELDVTLMSEAEREIVRAQIRTYKAIRKTIQFGSFYRLNSPYLDDATSWMFISKDQQQVVVFYFRHLAKANTIESKLCLSHLDPEALYGLEDGREYYGDTLMHFGLRLPYMQGDFASAMIVMTKK
jgi:alpha-galactosidase